MAYTKTLWVNDQAPARSAANLNKQEEGIYDNSLHVDEPHAPSNAEANDANTTTQGNTFNGINQLVQLDASGELPAVDGSNLTGLSSLSDPMTTRGDIIYRNASNITTRLGIGITGQVLKSDGTDISWGAPDDSMTTRGDIIYRNASNVTARLGIGSVGQVLKSDGTDISWGAYDIITDTTPQLGGDLDVDGNDIVSTVNGDINITPNGTGKTVITNIEAPVSINSQTGTTYAPVLADAEKMVTCTNASAVTVTIPANSSVAYPIGTKLNFMQGGAGAVTIAITTDTLSVTADFTLVLNGRYAVATAMKLTATTWVLFGNLVAS